jgi:hypothetical protein
MDPEQSRNQTPSPQSDGGEGRGEEDRFERSPSPQSSPHSFLVGRGRKIFAKNDDLSVV